MRIAVIGIGGIGGYLASKLCKVSDSLQIEVILIQRGEHLNAIKNHGLKYITKSETIVKPTLASDQLQSAGIFDLVFFAVKSRDLDDAARSIVANIHDKTILVSTLNGVNNARRLATIYPSLPVLNGCIYVSAYIEKPGVVKQVGGAGNFYFGSEDGNVDQYQFIEDLLKKADIKAVLSHDIIQDVWAKYIFISSWASISSKYGLPVGELLSSTSIIREWESLIREIRDTGNAIGVHFDENIVHDCIERASRLPFDNKTSMQIDIEQGKIPEVDVFTSYVIALGQHNGIETPAHVNVLKSLGY